MPPATLPDTPHDTPHDEAQASWVPMVTIALAQMLMSFNAASLPVAMSGMMKSFGVPPTAVSTAIVVYSMSVASLVMLGAKLNQRHGALVVFRIGILIFCTAMILMTISWSARVMIGVQALAGVASAALIPSLVALIANNYAGQQQATAIGALGAARAAAGVAAFLIGGILGTVIGWRPAFALVAIVAAVVLMLSLKLKPVPTNPAIKVDRIGVLLIGGSVLLISIGFNNINDWGLVLASKQAPFTLVGLSPAPLMIVIGLFLGQAFFAWTRRRAMAAKTPLLALQVIASPGERSAVYALFAIVALEAALNFTVPLYIQIVQGRSPFDTAIAMMPFNLTVFFAALLVVRAYGRWPLRIIAQIAFGLSAAALLWLALVVHNDWSTVSVILGLVVFGIGQGSLVTLLFNVLVTGSPRELAGDVGALRGTTNNLAGAVGTATIGALVVGLLSAMVIRDVAAHPQLPPALVAQVDLDQVTFVSNDQLDALLARTDATPEQVEAAVAINVEARLAALRIGLAIMAGLALLALIPAGKLPDYRAAALPARQQPGAAVAGQ